MAATTVQLKLLVDPKSHKVLFAEAGKDFVDFIFNIRSLPVGTVIRLLTNQGMVWCLGNLYESIQNLGDNYMQQTANKDSLLKPTVTNYAANVPLLLPDMQSSTTSTYSFYRCAGSISCNNCCYGGGNSNCRNFVGNDSKSICPSCKGVMSCSVTVVDPPKPTAASSSSDEGGYVKGVVTYMVMDDLVVKPMSTISSITLLNKFNVKDVGVLEERVIDMGMDQGVKLLKASMQSKTVLTDVFLGKKATN